MTQPPWPHLTGEVVLVAGDMAAVRTPGVDLVEGEVQFFVYDGLDYKGLAVALATKADLYLCHLLNPTEPVVEVGDTAATRLLLF